MNAEKVQNKFTFPPDREAKIDVSDISQKNTCLHWQAMIW